MMEAELTKTREHVSFMRRQYESRIAAKEAEKAEAESMLKDAKEKEKDSDKDKDNSAEAARVYAHSAVYSCFHVSPSAHLFAVPCV